jgi:hypothetical protein
LGQLSDVENDRLEEEIAVDPELFEEAQFVENELVDDYLRDDLSTSDRDAFLESYLRTDRRREKLAAAESIWRVANEQEVIGLAGPNEPPVIWRLLRNWLAAAVLAVMLIFGGVVYLGFRSGTLQVSQTHDPNRPLVEMTTTEEPGPKAETATNASAEDPDAPHRIIVQTNNGKDKILEQDLPASLAASFTLLPKALGETGEQSINIGSGTRTVDLHLALPAAATKFRLYYVAVKTADGDTAFEASGLKTPRVEIPAAKLDNRTYVIFLKALNPQNARESVAAYTFRVNRQKISPKEPEIPRGLPTLKNGATTSHLP